MNYSLKELLDIPTLQALLNSLDSINNLPSAVLDLEGNILTATSWQDICTKFHRVNLDTSRKCKESDTHIEVNIDESDSAIVYRCPMGLIDAAFPVIIEGKRLGNVFIGQLLLEPPEEAFFIEQAHQYGFDGSRYLDALRKVPVCSKEQLDNNLRFIGNFVQVLANNGLQSRLQLESEQKLRESEKKLKAIFETSEAGIIVVSPLGVITFANRRMAEMFGITLTELLGTKYIDHVHESDKQAGIVCMQKVISGETSSVDLVRHYIRTDGTDFWGNLTGTRFENIDGSMRDQIIVVSDISERLRAEEEKRSLEQQLQQAQKLESLGVLAGGIAHDFNNLLTVIVGYCGLLKNRPEKIEESLLQIEKAAERAAELCRLMLTYAGKAQSVLTSFSMTTLLDDMVRMLKVTIDQNVAIKLELPVIMPNLIADISQIRQIVMNLIINAAEAIGEAQGEIVVSLAKTEIMEGQVNKDYLGNIIPIGSYVCLQVTDNGSGMDDDIRSKIFEPFYTTKFTGRGLGMSATLGIISAHKGSLQLESQLGKGTTFNIYLPLPASESTRDANNRHELSPPWQGSGTILLVEDEEQLKPVVKIILEQLGFTVIEASNGREALEKYQQNSSEIKIIVTDLGMPVMNGYELVRELKNLNSILPIIVSSGYGGIEVTSKIARADIAGIISKPYTFDQLRDVLKSVVDKEQAKATCIKE